MTFCSQEKREKQLRFCKDLLNSPDSLPQQQRHDLKKNPLTQFGLKKKIEQTESTVSMSSTSESQI